MRRTAVLLTCLALLLGIAASVGLGIASAQAFPDPAMEGVWNRTDKPVADLTVARTWIWGPSSFDTRQESYRESPGGSRLVAYFDKSRMEINNPNGDRTSPWFTTNGLLAKELVSGQMQTGDNTFEARWSARIPVAGDPDDTGGPIYATFASLLAPVAERKAAVMDTIDRAGTIAQNGTLGNYTDYVYFVPETGHNIPGVFWDFLNSSGPVFQNGATGPGKLFDPTFFATGFPITEAYWSEVKVAGQVQPVLIQVFERRVLTFTPGNPQGWQVEMGNIGRHYFDWRYNNAGRPSTVQIIIANLSFQPSSVTIYAGDFVKWTNNDTVTHTVTSATWDSGNLAPGHSYARQFPDRGTVNYLCSIHPNMTGTVIVQ